MLCNLVLRKLIYNIAYVPEIKSRACCMSAKIGSMRGIFNKC
jgi:hypothetical protein